MNDDGSNQTRLTYITQGNSEPAWSSDGLKIIFTSDLGNNLGPREIFVMNADGSSPIRLTPQYDGRFSSRLGYNFRTATNNKTQLGVFRPSNGNWYLDYDKNSFVDKTFHFGSAGDIPVIGDWDGDGVSDAGIFRPSNGNWYLDTTKTGVVNLSFHFGTAGDSPIGGSTIPQSQPLQPSTTITFSREMTIIPSTTVYIKVGSKVIWKNEDPLKPHGIAAVDSQGAKYFGGLTGVQIPFNKTYEVTFDTPGYFRLQDNVPAGNHRQDRCNGISGKFAGNYLHKSCIYR